VKCHMMLLINQSWAGALILIYWDFVSIKRAHICIMLINVLSNIIMGLYICGITRALGA
jgi:hypothetical protein